MPRAQRPSYLIAISLLLTSVVCAQGERSGPATGPTVTVAVMASGVRFVAFGEVQQMRLEVFDSAGSEIFDSGLQPGNVRDWVLKRKRSPGIADGTYQLVVTIRDFEGRLSLTQCAVMVQGEQAALALEAAELASRPEIEQVTPAPSSDEAAVTAMTHDGREGQLTRTRGAFTFRLGDFFRGTDAEQMRLTEEGNLGIGTSEPKSKLDVAGDIRASGAITAVKGIQFLDGTVQTSGLNGRKDDDGNIIPNASGTGTQNQIAKWAETGGAGTLTNSIITETPAGNIGISNASPSSKLSVLGAVGAELRFDKGAQSITPVLNVISQPLSTTLGAAAGLAAGGGGSSFNFSDNLPFFIVKDTKANVVNNNLGFGTPLLTVHPSGNVGVGPTNPAAKLDVSGNINTSTQYNIGNSRVLITMGTNTLVGNGAGSTNAGADNTFVGSNAGLNNTGSSNSFFGRSVGAKNTGTNNSAFGHLAFSSNNIASGSNNSYFGANAGQTTTSGASNSFFGANAGFETGSGSSNSFFGFNAGNHNSVDLNSFFGFHSGFGTILGSSNSFFGASAGETNVLGSNNTVVGALGDVGATDLSNATAIGFRALVSQSNSLILGSISGVNEATADTKVGIGTTTPAHRLQVGAGTNSIITFADLAVFGANGAFSTVRDTTANVEALFGADGTTIGGVDGAALYGAMSAHGVAFRTGNNTRMAITPPGNIGIGTVTPARLLTVNGRARIVTIPAEASIGSVCFNLAGDLIQCGASSLRHKTDLKPFVHGLSIVKHLRPITFTWKNDGAHDIGLAAEEVARVAPEFTFANSAGVIEGVKYDQLPVLLIAAIQEQQQQIAHLQRTVAGLKKQMSARSSRRRRRLSH